jgi:hypothetical protein
MSEWLLKHLGPDVPLFFTAFHPDYKLRDIPPTPPETLRRAREIARKAGLRYVDTGNTHDPAGETTPCPDCGGALIVRDWHDLLTYPIGHLATTVVYDHLSPHGNAHGESAPCVPPLPSREGAAPPPHAARGASRGTSPRYPGWCTPLNKIVGGPGRQAFTTTGRMPQHTARGPWA